jgi:hypothetical protein
MMEELRVESLETRDKSESWNVLFVFASLQLVMFL